MRNTWSRAGLIRFALGAAIGVLFLFLPLGCGGGGAGNSASTDGSPTTSPSGVTGQVATTHNPQVALYTVTSPKDGMLTVVFGKTTSYGLVTASQPISAGKAISLYVAGMLATSTYHMQAAIQLADGSGISDLDHTFTTGALPTQFNLQLTVKTTSGTSPQPGIEMLDVYGSTGTGAVATDLIGNPLWTYYLPDGPPNALLFPIDLLPNGHILFVVEALSQANYNGSSTATGLSFLREVDLAGNVIRQLTVQDLNTRLTAAGFNVQLWSFHHDILALPNGHLVVLSNSIRQMTGLPGQSGSVPVLGDVIVDLDSNLQPVWVWDAFDHLDINRHPLLFPDWTHGNALLYSPSDGQLLISMRHQNWILKLDYRDGQGSGDVVWRLGAGGDFTLKDGMDPTDWFYAQHGPSFFSTNTSGVFSLGVMDNGNDRKFAAGVVCGGANAPPCQYSTVTVLQVDEGAKTATLTFHQVLPATDYSYFGGNAELMEDGDIAYTLCTLKGLPSAKVNESRGAGASQTVWEMDLNSQNAVIYRATRLPSLYPGVQR